MMGAVLGGVAGMALSDQPAVKGVASKEMLMLGAAVAGYLFEEDGVEKSPEKKVETKTSGTESRAKTPYERRLESELVKMHQRHENNLRLIEAAMGDDAEEEMEEAPPRARRASRLVPVGYAEMGEEPAPAERRQPRAERVVQAQTRTAAPARRAPARSATPALPDYGESSSPDFSRRERELVFNRDAEDIFG